MNLPAGVPMPKDAPPTGACVRVERPEQGLAVLVLDPPHRKLALLDLPLMRDLALALDGLEQDSALVGLVITGRTPTSFAAGADIEAIAALVDAGVAAQVARYGQHVFGRIEALKARTVAAVGGPVPGGACELALACDAIVLADDPSTRIGLPETQLGILPGWGGTQRLPRRIGVPRALGAILSGKLHRPREALKLGLVDRLAWPEQLQRIARDIAMGRLPLRRHERGVWRNAIDRNPLALRVIGERARKELLARTRGHYPAPLRALELVLAAPRTPLALGLEHEALALGELAVTPVCKSLVRIFQASEAAKRSARAPDGVPVPGIARAGVIGAGVMGAGIAGLLAERGIDARLSDVAREPLDQAVREHRRRVQRALQRRRMRPHEARAAIDRLEVSVGLQGFQRCDLVIEAVVEKLEVKRELLLALAAQAGPGAILATNTSSLSVAAIAAGLPHPERVVGMHFFNPVAKMPLVEVVRGPQTSDATTAATAKLAVQLGKTPIIVRDVAGFLVNRLLGPYLDEAARLLEQGAEPERIDRVARDFGLPMGPLELLDEVGLDVAAHAARSLEAAYGERMQCHPLPGRMLEAGFKGRKSGRGFYVYTGQGTKQARGAPNPEVQRFLRREVRAIEISDALVLDQLLLPMVNEAARCLEEQVVASPRELDLATVMGMGFPPFHGGLLRYADARGLRDVHGSLLRLSAAPDILARTGGRGRFQPTALLRDLAERDQKFHG